MDTATFSTFAALMAILANVLTLGLVGLRVASGTNAAARATLDQIGQYRILLAGVVGATCMAGSLYYSEVAGFTPCRYCWYQRFVMYPIPFIALMGGAVGGANPAVHNWTRRIIGWGALFGASISIYHLYLQNVNTGAKSCGTTSCTAKWVNEFGFISIPYMALSGFLLIAALSLLTYFRNPNNTNVVASAEQNQRATSQVKDGA